MGDILLFLVHEVSCKLNTLQLGSVFDAEDVFRVVFSVGPTERCLYRKTQQVVLLRDHRDQELTCSVCAPNVVLQASCTKTKVKNVSSAENAPY